MSSVSRKRLFVPSCSPTAPSRARQRPTWWRRQAGKEWRARRGRSRVIPLTFPLQRARSAAENADSENRAKGSPVGVHDFPPAPPAVDDLLCPIIGRCSATPGIAHAFILL